MQYLDILRSPAFWGLAGAFIWAAPEWLACAYSGKGLPLKCSLEFVIRLITGAASAAAFTPWALWLIHDDAGRSPPVAALIGLIANTAAPKIAVALSTRASKLFKGTRYEP